MCYAAFRTGSACAPILLWIKPLHFMSDRDRPQTGRPTRAARPIYYNCQVASAPYPCRRQIPPGVLSRSKISKSERGLTTPRVPWTAGRSS